MFTALVVINLIPPLPPQVIKHWCFIGLQEISTYIL